jgi:pyruvate/2-oxoglutarate dehydrogenase complex dihydrolipoamide acyltransferase (E2) component
VELVTDKATFNMPSPAAGKVAAILLKEGDEVNVGDTIMELE